MKEAKEAKGVTEAPDNPMQATFQADLKKAKKSEAENVKGAMTTAATQMFAFYANFFFVEAKYAWNKIVKEQTEGNPYVYLQGVSQTGPRGMSHKSFDDCVFFHLLTVFLINTAEQEKYYITNVLNSLSAESILAGEKLVAMYSIST